MLGSDRLLPLLIAAASLAADEIQDVSPIVTPGNSQVGAEVSTTFGDASPSNSFESLKDQSPGQLYNMVGISVDAESQPSREVINNLDKGGHPRHYNQDSG